MPADPAADLSLSNDTRPPRIVLAPDKFKGSLSARQVADHLAAGLRRSTLTARIIRCPIADGGDGTVDAVTGTGSPPCAPRSPARSAGPAGPCTPSAVTPR